MDSKWSLYEHLAQTSTSRFFSVPLASAVPDGLKPVGDLSHRKPTVDRFTVADLPDPPAPPGGPTTNKTFSIVINAGPGFTPEPDFPNLPDPAIRLHAMARALVRFRTRDQALVFDCGIFGALKADRVPWWQRWRDAGKIPKEIAFLNVDVEDLRTRIRTGTGPEVMPGLFLPALLSDSGEEVTIDTAQRQRFADGFFAGADNQFTLIAQAGAVMGQAGLSGAGPNRELRLEVRYADHVDVTNPQPMNPRELLYLLFGNDSTVATSHPLLQALNASVVGTPPGERNTRQMMLRPPLRTWKRLVWEAELEVSERAGTWAEGPGLPPNTLFNSSRRERVDGDGHGFDRFGYSEVHTTGVNKCNLYVSDVAIRAGFKVPVHHIVEPVWHYVDAGSYTNLARNAQVNAGNPVTPAPLPINSGGNNSDRLPWGMTYGQKIAAGMTAAQINVLMKEEGRCLIVTLMRPRKFKLKNNGDVDGDSCQAGYHVVNSGHMVFVKNVDANPVLTVPADPGFAQHGIVRPRVIRTVRLTTVAAFDDRAHTDQPWSPVLGGRAATSSAEFAAIRIQLIELLPGGDPDTIQGLRSLNVKQVNRNRLDTADEGAIRRRFRAGQPTCCVDRFPNGGVETENCPPGTP